MFAFGVCFFWPTMLGFVAENYPKTGALGLAIMGGAGMLRVSFVLPIIGSWYDAGIAARTGGKPPAGEALAAIQAAAGLDALGKVAVLPLILIVAFVLVALMRKKKGKETVSAPAH